MSPLPSDIRTLSVAERLSLIEQIWESIRADGSSFTLTEEQKAELDRRLEAYQKSADRGSAWMTVRRRLFDG
jgi:putative addiction module component (TIGR02574 family)